MKLRLSLLYTLAPWLFYTMGETFNQLEWGAGCALVVMLFFQSAGWYAMKWTDWTQGAYFATILAATTFPLFTHLLEVRSIVAPGFFLVMALGSLALGHPFTNQFAREKIPAEFWNDPVFPFHFARVNRILTVAWGMNFGFALGCAWLAHEGKAHHSWMFKGMAITSFVAVGALTRFFPDWYESHVYRPDPAPKGSPETISLRQDLSVRERTYP